MNTKEPDWLETLRDDLVCFTKKAAKQFWPSPEKDCPAFFNCRLEHVRQVERDALRLLSVVGGDRDIVLASVWIHDRDRPGVFGGKKGHAKRAAEWATEHLAETGFPADKIESVCFAVANHSNRPGTIPPEAHEARVLCDADELAKLGAAGLLFTFFNSYIALDRLRAIGTDPTFPEHTLTVEGIVSSLQKRQGKDLGAHLFYFEPSRRWAAERWEVADAFYESLCRQAGGHPCVT